MVYFMMKTIIISDPHRCMNVLLGLELGSHVTQTLPADYND